MSTRTADLGAQIAQHRDRLTETVGALADKIDPHDLAESLKEHATSGAEELRETAATEHGKRGLIIGAVAAFVGLVILRKLLR